MYCVHRRKMYLIYISLSKSKNNTWTAPAKVGQLSSWLRIIQIPVDITVLKYDHYFICTGFFPSTCPWHLQQDRQFRKTNQQLTFQHAPTIPNFTFPMYPLLISKHNRNVSLFKALRIPFKWWLGTYLFLLLLGI